MKFVLYAPENNDEKLFRVVNAHVQAIASVSDRTAKPVRLISTVYKSARLKQLGRLVRNPDSPATKITLNTRTLLPHTQPGGSLHRRYGGPRNNWVISSWKDLWSNITDCPSCSPNLRNRPLNLNNRMHRRRLWEAAATGQYGTV